MKDDIVNILKTNSIIISVGYQITNFGKKRNTKLEEVFVVDPREEIGIYFIAIERKTVSSLLDHFQDK